MITRPHDNLELPVKLTLEELDERSALLAAAVDRLDVIDAEKKEATSRFDKDKKATSEHARRLAKQIRTKAEDRVVECVWTADADKKLWTLYRQDTGEVVRREQMTKAELQNMLPFDA